MRRAGFIDQGLAHGIADDQFAAAVVGFARQVHFGGGRAPLGLGLANQCALQLGLRIDMAQACLGRVVVGLGLVEVSAVVLVVDAK
ncbi:hypothetical protein D3C84_910450 [compost metagenome]